MSMAHSAGTATAMQATAPTRRGLQVARAVVDAIGMVAVAAMLLTATMSDPNGHESLTIVPLTYVREWLLLVASVLVPAWIVLEVAHHRGSVLRVAPAAAWRVMSTGFEGVVAAAAFVAFASTSTRWTDFDAPTEYQVHELQQVALMAALVWMFALRRSMLAYLPWLFILGALANVVAGRVVDGPQARFTGLYHDPNFLGVTLLVAIAFAACEVARTGWIPRRVVAALACGGLAVALGATGSRGALVGLVAMLVALVLLDRRRVQVTVAGGVLVVVAAAAIVIGDIAHVTDTGSSGRIDLWRVAVEQWREHPAAGQGLGTYPAEVESHVPDGVDEPEHIAAHNTPLQVLAELGLIGLVPLLVIAFGAARRPARLRAAAVRDRSERDRLQLVALLGALVGAAMSYQFLTAYLEPTCWLLVALALSVRRSGAVASGT